MFDAGDSSSRDGVQIRCEKCGQTGHIQPTDSEWLYHKGCGGRMTVVEGQFENPDSDR